jgi:hypothetical protein
LAGKRQPKFWLKVLHLLDNLPWTFEEMTVRYTSAGKEMEVSYGAWFKVNGENVDMDYARYESPYVDGAVERKAEVITLRFNGKTLELNYKAGTRVY